MFDLTGKVALITGSSKGIGRATALQMAKQGAKVVISSRKADACEAVAEEVRAAGGEAMVATANVSDRDSLEALVSAVEKAWGQIDILVCNAAINPYHGPSAGMPVEIFEKTITTNVTNQIWLCNRVIPAMAERKDGSVTIISSIAAFRGSSVLGAYAITKAADVQIAKNLAREWGHANVRVNCIAPGLVKTDMARVLWEDEAVAKETLKMYALGRLGEPDDIAGTAVYLASRAGSWTTGQTIVVDGGCLS